MTFGVKATFEDKCDMVMEGGKMEDTCAAFNFYVEVETDCDGDDLNIDVEGRKVCYEVQQKYPN